MLSIKNDFSVFSIWCIFFYFPLIEQILILK